MADSPWTTIAEHEETKRLSFEMHIPLGSDGAEYVIVWDESSVRELRAQFEEFLTLVEQRRAMEEIVARDSGGH